MTKIAQVQRIEVSNPGDFGGLDKKEIVDKLEQRAGPKARKLFEKFISDVQKLKDELASGITFREMPDRATLKYAQLAISGRPFPPLQRNPAHSDGCTTRNLPARRLGARRLAGADGYLSTPCRERLI